jgi:hypothetical protein
MAGLDPAMTVFFSAMRRTWMPATSAGMTAIERFGEQDVGLS